MSFAIEVKDLKKSYGDVRAVKELSFAVKRGEFFAFLGENGAGKSTAIGMICGILKKDAGSVLICGLPPEENREEIARCLGVVFQNSVLDSALSVEDNLRSRAALYSITGKAYAKRLGELTELFDLKGILSRTVGKLSGGQRRRVDIARALLAKPQVLILDEPTTGLDPQTRKMIWSVIHTLRKEEGLTVFLTTHYMEEAAEADRVLILESGLVAAEGSPLELKNRYTGDFITLYGVTNEEALSLSEKAEPVPDGWRIPVKNTSEATRLIVANPALFRDYEITKGKMDDVFLAVTGRRMKGEEE